MLTWLTVDIAKTFFDNAQQAAVAGPTGIEPAAYGLRVRRSGLTELRAHKASLLKKVPLNNIELAVLLLQADAVKN